MGVSRLVVPPSDRIAGRSLIAFRNYTLHKR